MDSFEKVFWYFAIPFTIVFIIQTILTFVGMGDEGDFDGVDENEAGDGGTSFQIFTVRNFIIFFTIFGWTGIAAVNGGLNKTVTVLVAIFAGLIIMFIVAGIFYFMSRLTESGNMDLRNAVNRIGEVYITIPGNREGSGKIQLKFQEAIREIEAVTNEKAIPSGEMVRVAEVINEHVVLVERVKKD